MIWDLLDEMIWVSTRVCTRGERQNDSQGHEAGEMPCKGGGRGHELLNTVATKSW